MSDFKVCGFICSFDETFFFSEQFYELISLQGEREKFKTAPHKTDESGFECGQELSYIS
jgi:hypothetical protein